MGALSRSSRRCALSFTLPCTLLLVPLILYLQCRSPALYASKNLGDLGAQIAEHFHSLLNQRGATLLHSWSDEELIDRAMNNATDPLIASPAAAAAAGNPYSARFLGLFHAKFEIPRRPTNKIASKIAPKVAFLFLTTGSLPLEPLWDRFFRGNEALYNIYVHADPFDFEVFNRSSRFWGRLIPSRKTERSSPSLVAAMKRLMANALLDDPRNEFFAFISDSCIPLHGFRRIYKKLIASRDQSFIEVIRQSDLLWSRYNARGEGVMIPEVPFEDFTVGSQWFIANRNHAKILVGDRRIWRKFSIPCLPENFPHSCYTEEHYFPTVMNMVDPRGTAGVTLTHVSWPDVVDGHPRTYRAADISRDFIRRLQSDGGGRFLFARKFAPDCLEPLMRLADTILKH